ncbi:MAG: AAA domain-containing protein [Gammaproteobacteria bacterium]|nr:AAA domain-containing protein [Gammaproteobacteria bacterium]
MRNEASGRVDEARESRTAQCGFIQPLSVEGIRFRGEEVYAQGLLKIPGVLGLGADVVADPSRIRRLLLARSLQLSEGMAPDVHAAARRCASLFDITVPFELYQASGAENAAMHLVDSPVLLEIHGKLLALLDEGALLAILGHEFGHFLAHGPKSPHAPLIGVLATLLHDDRVPDDVLASALRYSMARELTADRFGLLACGDLNAALRLEMVAVTGLSGETLTWDTQAYLAQSRELMEETLSRGETALASTHPEHSLRAYALWLFSETDLFRALTGQGSGSRTLAEVDEILMQILGRPDIQLGVAELLDEPPPEMHECALAACVLVASSDGELHDSEMEAIERVFAPLLPEWRTLLDAEHALARFQALAPLVSNGGPKVQRALFALLAHVLAVDGEAHEAEIDTILAIGAALGCRELYRSLLTPVLDHFGMELTILVRSERIIPMPARSGEAQAALRVYFDEASRRGGGRVTLRRLLRLLGETRRSDEVVNTIAAEAARAGLVFEPTLGEELDQLHELVLTPEAAAARTERSAPPPVGQGGDTERLRNGLARLRDRLISGDGRSPSVRLRTCRTGRNLDLHLLERVSTGLAERTLTLLRSGRKARVVDAAETVAHEGARGLARELVALDREHRARVEETGAYDLHLGYPFVTGLVGGYLFRAPLLLYPVTIERGDLGSASYGLAPVEGAEPCLNQSAVQLMFARKRLPYPDDLAEKLDALALESPQAVFGELERLGLGAVELSGQLIPFVDRSEELDGWRDDRLEVEECAVLGLFPQSGSDLLQDYDELLDAVSKGESPSELLSCAVELLPGDLKTIFAKPTEPPAENAPEPVPVIYADPSQRAVLARARGTRALVVDGPPGTGKSQVIVNLVADALARGERVAVVCEKRAALDVVANRLDSVGMRHLLAVVHDVQEDRRALFDQVVSRLTERGERGDQQAALKKVAEETRTVFDGLQEKSLALAVRHGGLSLGELHTFAAGVDGDASSVRDGLDRLALERMEQAASDFERLRVFADLWGPASPWLAPDGSAPRATFTGFDAPRQKEVAAAMDAAFAAARAFESACTAQGLTGSQPASVEAARVAINAASETCGHCNGNGDRTFLAALLARATQGISRFDEIDAAVHAWRDAGEAPERFGGPVRFVLNQLQLVAVEDIRRLGSGALRFLNPTWWKARSQIRQLLSAQWSEKAGARIDVSLANEVADRHATARAWLAIEAIAALAGGIDCPQSANMARSWLGHAAQLARDAIALAGLRAPLEEAQAWPKALLGTALEEWGQRVEARRNLLGLRDAVTAAMQPLCALLPWLPNVPSAAAIEALSLAWSRDGQRLAEADGCLEAARGHFPEAERLLRGLAAESPSAPSGSWADALRKAWSYAAITAIETTHASIRRLDAEGGDTDARHGARLSELLHQYSALNAEQLLAAQDERPFLQVPEAEKGKRRTPEQASREAILKEARKKNRLLPLRSFVRRFWNEGLLDAMPVWLLSPETMAVLFPRAPVFDLVILDEGSQCTVESGLPVLMRARRAVVAGDEKQMPPSSFFKGGDEDNAEVTSEAREMFDAESLLVLARARAEHIGLQWHYRCLHEELIAFSNHALYAGGLRTIPSTASRLAPAAIRWVAVPDGRYEEGANPAEAVRVVELIGELLARPDQPSVGIVTFNLYQRRAILDEIDSRRAEDAGFAALFDEAMARPQMDQRPFVKNLESVQGDERDVIVFSLGHAPVERTRRDGKIERYVPARFGPLGQKGGERRLNVAVSRAKKEIIVVASFEPGLLSVARSKNEGPKLFKGFLEFAHHMSSGQRNQAERVLSLVRSAPTAQGSAAPSHLPPSYVPLKAQIAMALEEKGVRSEMDVGTSDFRVQLAVVDARNPGNYRLGILCEEGLETRSPLETHVHTPNVLTMRGWKIVRITGREWERDPDAVIGRILTAAA